ncbi:hypothetical protein C8R46DRAFT_1136281 [Mycena filopes]|nr:hypothetical protein C8R46DRAFT_1136281 [Mycena filopes]
MVSSTSSIPSFPASFAFSLDSFQDFSTTQPTMLTSFIFAAAALAGVATADHRITLRNNCGFAVGMTLSNFPGNVVYNGPAIPAIQAGASFDVNVPNGWNGRICDHPPNSACENDCFGGIAFGKAACSMTEWNFNAASIGGVNDYDISNIQGFSVAQQIVPDNGGGAVVTCKDVNCPCNEAYRPGDISGTCGGTGPLDQATRTSGVAGYTVVYCP